MQKFIKTLKDIGDLIVFKHSVFALPFIFTAMIVASKHVNNSAWFGWKLLILGVICAVSARNFAMAFNRYSDEDIDKLNPRTANRPSVDGRIGRSNLLIFIIANAAIFVIVAWFINDLAFWLSFPILAILGGYSLFKRFSELAHLVLGLSLGLAPIAGAVAISASIPLWSALLCLGVMFWVAGFDLLYSLQDMEFDREKGLFSIPSIYGEKATMFISAIFHANAVLLWLLFAWAAKLGVWAFLGIITSGVILFFEHKIVRKDFSKIDRAFFTLNGYLGILFFIFIWIDL
ncbi:menaquinone biosynthesis prenyltransferase MqnP [Campylobacter sp. RM16192]|uniref:menaquinone biosynthesis prenyltransferase MqnP n=1 Tax=Campylobacter sp. RM16192 TaxID=1660080 RepID=UPI00145193AE|nr:menaquinone biosynthesis prenyltransferase MqnP [Campylobacter sp. RM16192]QCD53312.1 4-hydroxybenzoate octaprenyltransferase [Campylobacter sp. RM16192]